jgi:prolyl-tRNA synthetase
VLVRRDTREKAFVPVAGLAVEVPARLDAIQKELLDRAWKFVGASTTHVKSYDEFKQVMEAKRGFLVAGWCGDAACEAKVKEETKATIRVIPTVGEAVAGECVRCGKPSPREVYFAQAY